MGKASRAKQEPKQPKIDHFTLVTEDYIALRRYMGSKPHDETRQLIEILERMPAVTEDDVALLVKQAERLAELEALNEIGENMVNGAGQILDNPGEDPDLDLVDEGEAMVVIDEENDPDVANDAEEEQ